MTTFESNNRFDFIKKLVASIFTNDRNYKIICERKERTRI